MLFAGEVPRDFGIVLEGGIVILKEEFSGSTTLLSQGFPGEIFAEAFAASGEPSGDGGGGKEDENPVDFLRTDDAARRRRKGKGETRRKYDAHPGREKPVSGKPRIPPFQKNPAGRRCSLTWESRRRNKVAGSLIFHLTGRSLRIIWRRTEAHSRRCLVSCKEREY